MTRTSGLPRFVTTTARPVAATSSMIRRQCALKSDAARVAAFVTISLTIRPRDGGGQAGDESSVEMRTPPGETARTVADVAARLRASASVAGVTAVEEEDREVWIVAGNPGGDALVRSVADFVDRIQDQIRAHIESL